MWFVKIFLDSAMFGLSFMCDWEDRALQECNLSAQSNVDCQLHPPPGEVRFARSFFGMPLQATANA